MKPHLLSPLPLAFLSMTAADAAISIDSSTWSTFRPATQLSNQSPTGLNWGDGTANNNSNADNSFLTATLDGDSALAGNQSITLNLGETLTLTGNATLTGITSTDGSLQFRFGLFDSNSSPSNGFGWLGYFVGNGTQANQGGLYAKNDGNTAGFIVESQSTRLLAFNGGTAANDRLTAASYNFTLSLRRTATDTIFITSSLLRDDGISFASVSYEHTGGAAPEVSRFDRIGFLAGDGLDTDRVVLSDLSLTTVPEPSAAVLGLAATALLAIRRRR